VHNNYYFLRQLSARLEKELAGFTIVSSFSQSKEELIIEFNNGSRSFFIKASLQSSFSCLSFPDKFHRARKNSIDLFNDVLMKKVIGVKQFENERSFSIEFENSFELLFKMHGNRANVLLLQENEVKEIFRNHLEADLEIHSASMDRSIDWSKEAFIANLSKLPEMYFTFGKEVWNYLKEIGFDQKDTEGKWNEIQKTITELLNPKFYILESRGKLVFSLVPFGNVLETFIDPIQAINEFFHRYTSDNAFFSEKTSAVTNFNNQLKASKNYIAKNSLKLKELQDDHHYQAWADLIMANLHRVKTGDDKVEVENFYNDNRLEIIKLKKELSAQKNAEVYYRKSKNQVIEIEKLKEAIARKEKEIEVLQKNLEEITSSEDLKSLRKNTETSIGFTRQEKNKVNLPFHEFEFKGYKIWVGKNAESNDKLTLHHSFKEDLWLHAKDVPGSHVLIKHQAGKNFPKDVIERAAELAAYNSKRKTESLCAVIFTPKKFVRKRKGEPAGAVVVEREEVILVEPKLEASS
jgi:predicted ribosome quality control (RQC) complex YloA/Tae2 family protein